MKPSILYIYPRSSTFIERDIGYFSSEYEVKRMQFLPPQKWLTPLWMLLQLFQLLFKVLGKKAIVCQFAGYHTVIPTLIGKTTGTPCIIIASGTECANFPQIDYGNFRKTGLSRATCLSFKMASQIVPVHESLAGTDYTYSEEFPKKQGIRNLCADVKTPITAVNYGFDKEVFRPTGDGRIPRSFATMAFGIGSGTLKKLKGADLILEVALKFPDCTFHLIGAQGLEDEIPNNVKIQPPVPINEVPKLLNQFEFYLQLSISEGFPNALAESMLCGCVPIGSNVTAIPDIIGETGFILKKRNVDMLAEVISEALNSDVKELSQLARRRIIENHPATKRQAELLAILNS